METVEPVSVKAIVVLKKPAIDVIVPSLGTENARFDREVVSIVPPEMLTPVAVSPKAIILVVPRRPPRAVVRIAGIPDA